ncbi:acyltransferase [Aeromonas jandaei]|nr:acyltransferase [Aeromonas jandaei]
MDNFRAISIIFVILSHLNFYGLDDFNEIIKFILADATTFFVFISGFLFHHLSENNFNFKRYITKKSKFVGCPYLLISSILIVVGLALGHNIRYDLQPLSYIAFSLWAGGLINGPTWFIPMIWCFFIFSPLLMFIAKKTYIFPIIVFSALFISLFSARPYMGANPVLSAIHFFGFYMFGMYLSKNPQIIIVAKKHAMKVVMACIISLFFIMYRTLSGKRINNTA